MPPKYGQARLAKQCLFKIYSPKIYSPRIYFVDIQIYSGRSASSVKAVPVVQLPGWLLSDRSAFLLVQQQQERIPMEAILDAMVGLLKSQIKGIDGSNQLC